MDRLAEGWLHAGVWVPGITAVHVTVVTADSRIVLARRHTATPYAPGTWSASFEEQLTATDIRAGDVLHAAACRGVAEELGTGIRVISVQPLSLIVEMPILNTAPVLLLTVAERMSDLRDAAAAAGAHDGELTALADIDDYLSGGDRLTLHPTSALRLQIVRRWLRRNAR